jgi:hypothetical protein
VSATRAALAAAVLLALTGCGRHEAGEVAADASSLDRMQVAAERYAAPAPAKALQAPEGTFLAYEHDVSVRLPGADIAKHVAAVRDACQQQRFGDCAVLHISEEGDPSPEGEITVRSAPAAVEPLIKLAGESGEIASRSSSAEDLAQQVADTGRTRARLENEHARLLEYQRRGDLKMADLLTLSQRLAEIEGGLQQASQEAAQQKRRIDTQRLTINFSAVGTEQRRSELGQALSETGEIFTGSVALLIRFIAGVLPPAILLAVLVWLARVWWRRKRRKLA